jgi:hypothetical protein
MRVLLSNLISGAAAPENINRLSLQSPLAGSRSLFEDETLLESQLLRPDEADRLRPAVYQAFAASGDGGAVFMKAHDAWTRLADGAPLLGRSARGALYFVRDPRDVAVSFACFQARDFDELIRDMNCTRTVLGPNEAHLRQRLGDWSGHVRSWLEQTDIPVYLVRYEDLLGDAEDVLRGVLRFLGGTFDGNSDEALAIARAVRHAAFRSLQQQERETGFRERGRTERLLKDGGPFFREGRAGSWRRRLNEEQVRRIETAHAATMTRLGYSLAATDHNAFNAGGGA